MTIWRPEALNKDHFVTYGPETWVLLLFLLCRLRR